MEIAISLMILTGTITALIRFARRHGAEPSYYDWPVSVYRVRLWWEARRRPEQAMCRRVALGRIPGESECDWAQRRDAHVG